MLRRCSRRARYDKTLHNNNNVKIVLQIWASYRQGSYSFELLKFHDFNPWLFPRPYQVLQDLRFSCQLQKIKTFTYFRAFFDLKQFNRHKLWRSLKRVPITLLNYSSLSYIVLALFSAVYNLSNKTLIFHDFQGPTTKFHDFPGLEMKFWNSMTFQVFHDLYEPCIVRKIMNDITNSYQSKESPL